MPDMKLKNLSRRYPPSDPMNNRKEDMEIASHYRQLLRELNEQRQHGILCDACVVVEGKIFKAHKNVLLGSSRYFKTLYCQVKKGTEQQATITHLDIVTAQGFKTILDFMYSAHLALTSKNVIEVMSAASYLQMTEIVQACHGFIRAALDISIRSELADMELSNIEIGGIIGTGMGTAGGASEALVSMISARSSSPWLVRRTSPANSSGDSAIASCHESGSTYSKEEHEPKSHEDTWPNDYRSLQVKEEQGSPSSAQDRTSQEAQGTPIEQTNGGEGGWQAPGSRRRKNRKNKDTVRHIMQQNESSSCGGSPMPSMISTASWSYNNQADIPGADEAEPSSDTRDQRMDFFMKQEEALSGELGFHGSSLASDREEVVGESKEQGGSVANLRAALMSKNSLLSLGTEMFSEENTLLFDYLPKGGHSLSRSHCSSGGHSKCRTSPSSSSSTLAPLHLQPLGAFSLPLAVDCSENQDVEQDAEPSPPKGEMQEEEDKKSNTAGSSQAVEDQMAKKEHGVHVAQELACSLCKQLFSSLLQLRQHEYNHTFSLMQLSVDCFEAQHPPSARYQCSRCPASFTLKSNADRHEKTIHFKCKLLQCSYCLKHFRDRTDLNRHLASVHSGEGVYACSSCSRVFATQKNLITHIRLCLQVDSPSTNPHNRD